MTLGPMPCRGCHVLVWYDHGRIVDRVGKRHSCKPAHAGRAQGERARTWTPEYRRAYKREWMRRKRAAA